MTTSIGDTVDRARALLGPLDWDATSVNDRGELVLPSGTVTLLLADVEGSTRGWEERAQEMTGALKALGEVVDSTLGWHQGVRPVEQGEGDSFVAAFARASDAVACALEIQRQLAPNPLRLRMGIHTGEVQLRDEGNYVGPALNRTARLRDAGHGGQVVLSQATCELVRDRLPEGGALRDLGVHRLKDLGRPEHVYQLVHSQLGDTFPPLRSVDHLPNNLPVQLTSFVGREPELAVLRKLLGETRMLTLTGSGGCGKTRLALELAARALERFPDGTWLVELAPITDPTLIASTVAAAAGVREQQGRRALDVLVDHLASQTALVVLDNCEHLVDATAEVAERILLACPGVVVLATSREQLGVPGETAWRVPSLSFPSAHEARLDALKQYEAVQLFVERARKVRPNFTIDDTTVAPVAAICHRLDGIPLAVELAAARTRVLSPQQILDGLDDRFRLLTGGARTAVARQQTLRGVGRLELRAADRCRANVVRASFGIRRWLLARRRRSRRRCRSRRHVRGAGSAAEPCRSVAAGRRPTVRVAMTVSVIACSRRSGSTRASASPRRTRPMQFGRGTASSTSRSRSRPRRTSNGPSRRCGPTSSTSRTRTSVPRSGMRTIVRTRSARSGWSRHCSGTGSSADISVSAPGCAGSHWSSRARFGPRCAAAALVAACHVGWFRVDPSVIPLAQEAVDAAREAGDRRLEGRALYHTGVWAGPAGAGRAEDLEASIAIAREAGDSWGLAIGLAAAGTALNDERHITAAAALFEEAIAVCDDARRAVYRQHRPLQAGRACSSSSVAPPTAKRCCVKPSRTLAAPETSSPSRWPSPISVSPVRCRVTSTAAWRSSRRMSSCCAGAASPGRSTSSRRTGSSATSSSWPAGLEDARLPLATAEASGRAISPLADSIVGLILSLRGRVEQALGETDRAGALSAEALALLENASAWPAVPTRHNAACIALDAGDLDSADRLAHEALTTATEAGEQVSFIETVPVLDTLGAITDDARDGARGSSVPSTRSCSTPITCATRTPASGTTRR